MSNRTLKVTTALQSELCQVLRTIVLRNRHPYCSGRQCENCFIQESKTRTIKELQEFCALNDIDVEL